jgi:hypothetical protein
MRTVQLAGPVDDARPMNPASNIFDDGDLIPVGARIAQEISALFGYTRASLVKRAETNSAKIMRNHRRNARRMVILSLVSTIRGLERHLKDADVHTEDFLAAAREEMATLKTDLIIRLAKRNA